MSRVSDRDLTPRNGHTLMAGLAARISGCAKQKEMSLEDQTDHNKEVVEELYDGPIDYLIIATKGKGERLDRPELAQIETEFRKGNLDILVIEDLGRLVRGVEAVRLLGIAVDHGVRVIAPNDNVDTANATWEADATKASADHIAHQEHTSRRLKHKLKNRFMKFGGAMAKAIGGYIVPPGAKTYDDWQKDPASDPKNNPDADTWIYDGKNLLRETLNCSAVAKMFNRRKIPPGPYCRRKIWNGPMVRRFYSNPLLKGMATRGTNHSKKFHESGQRRSVRNPKGPVYYACPHLAYFDEAEFDELQLLLKQSNSRYRRKPVNGNDPLLRAPRKETKFPGQHGRCWYCGHHHVWGGNGMTENLMCSDVTSTYFEGQAQANPLAQRGYSRDHRPDCKQVCIGLVVTRCGLPLGYEVFAGNRHDSTTLEEIVETMEARYGRAQRVWALDRGMVSQDNLDFLKAGGRQSIVGTPKSQLRRFERQLAEQDWRVIREGLEVKLCPCPDGGSETYILGRSRDRREKEQAMHARFEKRIEDGLVRIEASCRKRAQKPGAIERRVGRLLGLIAASGVASEIRPRAGPHPGLLPGVRALEAAGPTLPAGRPGKRTAARAGRVE